MSPLLASVPCLAYEKASFTANERFEAVTLAMPSTNARLGLGKRVIQVRGAAKKWLTRRAERLAYDVTGLPMAIRFLMRPRRPSPEAAPADYLHWYYGRAYWALPWGPVRAAVSAILWPVALTTAVAVFTRRNGKAIAERSGVSVLRQAQQQVRLAATNAIAPFWYYMFEFYLDDHRKIVALYLTAHETIGPCYEMLQPPAGSDDMDDKVWFANHCRRLGIRAIGVLFHLRRGQMVSNVEGMTQLPDEDLFIKPRNASGGHNSERWDFIGDNRYRNSQGETLAREALTQRLAAQSLKDDFIVQPRLCNHPALADISNDALVTVRVLTCRNEVGGFEATNAAFRMAIGGNSVVDNFHEGGIATHVDLATGRIGAASDMGIKPDVGWREVHPVSGVRFSGRQLPIWPEVLDLACRIAAAFPERVVVGWDVAMLADGPCIVEGNGRPDLDIHQRVERRPLGNDRISHLLAWNLERAPARRG